MKKLFITLFLLTGPSLLSAGTGRGRALKDPGVRSSGASVQELIRTQYGTFRNPGYVTGEEDEDINIDLFVNAGLFLPFSSYMNPYAGDIYTASGYKPGIMLGIGNYFHLLDGNRFNAGLRATWIQAGFGRHRDTSYSAGNAFASPFRVGPQMGFSIGENAGVDLFYQLGAQYNIDWWHGENLSYAGLSQEVGLSLRYGNISGGVAYRYGGLRNINTTDPDTRSMDPKGHYPVKSLRFFLGMNL